MISDNMISSWQSRTFSSDHIRALLDVAMGRPPGIKLLATQRTVQPKAKGLQDQSKATHLTTSLEGSLVRIIDQRRIQSTAASLEECLYEKTEASLPALKTTLSSQMLRPATGPYSRAQTTHPLQLRARETLSAQWIMQMCLSLPFSSPCIQQILRRGEPSRAACSRAARRRRGLPVRRGDSYRFRV